MKTQLVLILFWVFVLMAGYSKPPTETHFLEQAVKEAPKALSFKHESYEDLVNNEKITIVGLDELEYQTHGDNLVCKYTVQDKRLRVILNVLGTTRVIYYDITDNGLFDKQKGQIFLSEAGLDAKCISNAKQLALACKVYARDFNGKYPTKLQELVPDYIGDVNIFELPHGNAPRFNGNVIEFCRDIRASDFQLLGGNDTDPPAKVIVRSKSAVSHGRGIVIFADGRVDFIKE